ncbi:hypothetical protein C6P46_005017 [Rhodotorula mucilaginosa]|uniref:Tetratricopeptide SHNi-TPR domain-containing protein n=1 Tax=Rhodotorula mucilaginosa TaxID=5537 RepID=A0A9P7B5W3_RHOMI|nr:hypothetical protein C6P46_005017 [Rhodotorula mucilaginosa]
MPSATDNDHLARGIRALALKHWNDACDQLAQAVEQATAKYGDLAPENVEPLILYGKALLGSAIAQSAVLGGAAPGADEAAAAGGATNASFASAGDAAVGGSSSSAAAAAATAGSTTAGPSKPNFHFGGDADDDNDNDDGEEAGAGDDGGANDDDDDEENGAATGGDREDDLESAFQVLDMARATLEKEINADGEGKQEEETGADKLKEKKERLAEVHRLLGDVATESEQFDNAVEEYTSALNLLTSFYAPSNRALSELHMLIALALDFVPNANDRAVSHAEKAKKVLLLKLDELEQVGEPERDDKTKREIEDIKGLMGDVDMKIEDLKTVPVAPAPTATDTALEAFLRQSTATMSSASASGEVNDLTSLVKKKKKPVPAPGVVQEEIKPSPDATGGAAAGAEENTIVIRPEEEEQAATKRKADDEPKGEEGGAADGETAPKKAKLESDAAGSA